MDLFNNMIVNAWCTIIYRNYYVGINLDEFRNICTVDKLIGDWQVIFSGTNYENLEFKIIKQIIPGMEKRFEPVC